MRTTVDINETLLHAAEAQATATNRTLAAVIEDALRSTLLEKTIARSEVPIPLPTSGSGGLLPGVDLNNSAALLELLESER